MKKALLLYTFFGSLFGNPLYAQFFQFQPFNEPMVTQNGRTLAYPFAGGMATPQFQEIDLDGDGLEDLVVFERLDQTVTTYLRKEENGQFKWVLALDYRNVFPPLRDWFYLVDLNGNGRKDLFTGSNGGVTVYQNVGVSQPAFVMRAPVLDAYWDFGFRAGILVMNIDKPGIADMDGDGDIDILSFDNFDIGKINYYRNMSMERYGHPDSLDYLVVSRCWGRFEESQFNSDITMGLNANCFAPLPTPNVVSRVQHVGSTILPINADRDTLMDILLGDVETTTLKYLRNGGTDDTARVVQVINNFPDYDSLSNVRIFPAAYLVDVDHDGRKDLLMAPNDYYESTLTNHVWYYKNQSITPQDSFRFQSKTFLVEDILQYYTNAAPLSVDVDGDGKNDLLVAFENGQYKGVIHHYKNTGTPTEPHFTLVDTSFLQLDTMEIRFPRLAGGDLDGDGKADLLIGHTGGALLHYKNNSSGGNVSFSLQSTAYQQLNLVNASSPELVDLNRDGKLDLLVGVRSGEIHYYVNTGTTTNASFSLVTATLGNVRVTDFFTGFAVPRVSDFNMNGDYDLMVGAENGKVYFFPDIEGNLTGTFANRSLAFFYPATGVYDSTRHSYYASPAVLHLNADSLPDILIGTYRGGVLAFRNSLSNVSVAEQAAQTVSVQVYPNPSLDGRLTIALDLDETAHLQEVKVYDLQGRLLERHPTADQQQHWLLQTRAKGLLLLQVTLSDGRVSHSRVVVP